jgi:hypothetical protein
MDIHVRKITVLSHGQVFYVIFWDGKIGEPIALLTEYEFKRFLAEGQEQLAMPIPTRKGKR